MRVVVFGGAGFVGLSVVERLLGAGDELVLFDRLAPPMAALDAFAAAPGRAHVVIGDVNDAAAVRRALDGAEACVYAAAVTSDADRERREARRVFEVNVIGLLTVLEAAHRASLRRVVNLSSGSAYGASAFGPKALDEAQTAPDPRTLYSLTKFAGERLASRLAELWGLDVRSARLSSVFGRWERATGVRDTLSPPFQVMRAALRGEPVRFAQRDIRDWIYAPDVARAVEALLRHPAPVHDLYNIAPPTAWDIIDWARYLRMHFPALDPQIDPSASTISSHGSASRQPFRTERLERDLGLDELLGLEASADAYAAWAMAHRELVAG